MTLISFLFFTLLVAAGTWWLTRKDDLDSSSAGYFLAGRSLGPVFVAGSLLLTNLSTEQLVGLNGLSFAEGMSAIAWEVGAGFVLIALALFFLPRYLRSGIATIPEFLGARFGSGMSLMTTLLFLVAYSLVLLPIILYTGARALMVMLDVPSLTGVQDQGTNLWITVWVVGSLGAAYAIYGGLKTVAVSDTLNGIGLLIGGLMITILGLAAVAGPDAGWWQGFHMLREAQPDHFHTLGRPDQSIPWTTLFTGVTLINLCYWTCNQQIIQRTLAARSLADGQKGILLASLCKMVAPLILVLPGIIAWHLFGSSVAKDDAYAQLVKQVLPAPLSGFFAAVIVGAVLSTYNSVLNSSATLFSLNLYRDVWKKGDAAHARTVHVGRIFGLLLALFSVFLAPMLANAGGIFNYLQQMNSIYFIPLLIVVLGGLLTRSPGQGAALAGFFFSLLAMLGGSFVFENEIKAIMNHFHYTGAVFAAGFGVFLITGHWWKRPAPYVGGNVEEVDLTPWRWAWSVSLALMGMAVGLYLFFL